MFRSRKSLLSLSVAALVVTGLLISRSTDLQAAREKGVTCTVDVVVESVNQDGVLISREVYQRDFDLLPGGSFFDDFSTATRFKDFRATLSEANGESTVSMNWFADVTVFNSVDLSTAVILANGQKTGTAVGDNTVYTSNGSTSTTYSLACTRN